MKVLKESLVAHDCNPNPQLRQKLVVPSGTIVHDLFVDDFSWYYPEVRGYARTMLLHDMTHRGISVPKELVIDKDEFDFISGKRYHFTRLNAQECVIHFLAFASTYDEAINVAREMTKNNNKLFACYKYNNKSFGGGIKLSTNLDDKELLQTIWNSKTNK